MTASTSTGGPSLTIVLDVRHPQAYLALGPSIRLGASLDIAIDWLPLPVPPLKPPSTPAEVEDRGTRHRRHRANAIAREIEVYARGQDLVLREFYRDADADAVNLGWLWMREHHADRLVPTLLELFRAYWALELDASDLESVARQVESFGADRKAFLTWAEAEGPALAARVAGDLHMRGVFSVPGYLVEGEVFLGRQHLPMIRWILEGRTGPIPI